MKRILILVIGLSYCISLLAGELRFPLPYKEPLLKVEEQYPQAWWPWPSDEPLDESSDEPSDKLLFDIDTILNLEEKLSEKIVGQSMALKFTTNALLSYAAGIHDGTKPIASLLYIGPTGVEKTELAKELARQLYGDENQLIRLNMSEYNLHYSIMRLIGAPPGYIGSDQGGQLSNAILKNPNTIILLDEFDKAHPEVRALFLHIFDEGWFNSALGNYVNCRKCIFIATSNLGAQQILDLQAKGFDAEEILIELEEYFVKELTPELYNRLEPVIFTGLTNDLLQKLVPLKLKELSERIYKIRQISVTFDETLVQYLRQHGYNTQLGARPLQRLIKKEIESAIAKAILYDHYQAGEKMHVSYDNVCVVITKN